MFRVRLFVTDGKNANVLAGETDITIRDVTGTWLLTIKNDPQPADQVAQENDRDPESAGQPS